MENNKKVAVAYTVLRYEDGSADVKDAEMEGTERISNDEIFKDIEEVARLVQLKRIENAAFVAAYNGTAKFYQDVNQQQGEVAAPEEAAE